jgi:adenylate cyclase
LALSHLLDAAFGSTDSRERSIEKANRIARKSLELDEREPVAYVALAHASGLVGQREQMIGALERAVQLNPNNASLYGYLGFALSYTGRADEAISHLEKAMRLSPKDQWFYMWLTGMGFAHFSEGRYEAAVDWTSRSVRLNADNELAYRSLAASYAQLGRLDEARAAAEEELRLDPDLTIAKVRSQNTSTPSNFLERWLDGLRKAGLPEGTEA